MKEYKYVKIHDDSSGDDVRMEEFVDQLQDDHRRYLYSAVQHGGVIILTWNGKIPDYWISQKNVEVSFSFGSDHWEVFNELQDYRLPDSLHECLRLIKDAEYPKSETIDDTSICTPENMRVLEIKGFIQLETEIDSVRFEPEQKRPIGATFSVRIVGVHVTENGNKYLDSTR